MFDVSPPLTDERGRVYEATELPCVRAPYLWDEEQPRKVKALSANVCITHCPALRACAEQALELGFEATGVWGGRVIPSGAAGRDTTALAERFDMEHDRILTGWLRDSGAKIPVSDGDEES